MIILSSCLVLLHTKIHHSDYQPTLTVQYYFDDRRLNPTSYSGSYDRIQHERVFINPICPKHQARALQGLALEIRRLGQTRP